MAGWVWGLLADLDGGSSFIIDNDQKSPSNVLHDCRLPSFTSINTDHIMLVEPPNRSSLLHIPQSFNSRSSPSLSI